MTKLQLALLSVFALLKSGVRPEHPGVRRGLEFLRAHPPSKTYSAGCQLLAFCTAGREEDDERIEELAELVISWKRQGGYAYPEGAVDISCSQFGALGLRAAAQAGVEVPLSIWEELAEDFREEVADARGVAVSFAALRDTDDITVLLPDQLAPA